MATGRGIPEMAGSTAPPEGFPVADDSNFLGPDLAGWR